MNGEVKWWRVAALLGLLLLTGAAEPAEAQTRIRLGTLVPKGTSYHVILQTMGERWKQAPGGVVLTIYTDGTMGNEADMVRRMRVGQLQAAALTAGGLAEIEPSVSALQSMPMMFRSYEEVDYVRGKLEEKLNRKFEEKGFVILFWGDAGWVRFFSKRPALLPADFRTMKIFTDATGLDQIELMKAAGYKPVPLNWNDALTALQTDMVDAVPVIPYYALAGQFYGIANHMVEVNWAPLTGAVVITKQAWDSFAPETREALRKAAAEAGVEFRARGRAESQEAVEAMKKRGLVVHTLTPEQEGEWRRTAEDFYPKIRGKMVPAEMFDEVRALLAEYRSTRAGARP